MKFRIASGLSMLMLIMAFLISAMPVSTSAQPYQKPTTAKYVKTAEDTVLLSGSTSFKKTVTIYNHSDTVNLICYFGNDSGKITNSYIVIPPKKHYKVTASDICKVYRHAAKDSVFTQVVQGEFEMGLNEYYNLNPEMFKGNLITCNSLESDRIRLTKFPLPVIARL